MKTIEELIFYYRSCPLCKNWMTLDVDLPIPTSLEIRDDALALIIIGKKGDDNKEYLISFKDNKIKSDEPFVFNDIVSTIKKLYLPNYSESLKIESRCYGCNNFRYWSKIMVYNKKLKKLKNISIAGERVRLHDLTKSNDKISYIISNNIILKETSLFVLRNLKDNVLKVKLKFMPFKDIDFDNREEIINKIKKILVLA